MGQAFDDELDEVGGGGGIGRDARFPYPDGQPTQAGEFPVDSQIPFHVLPEFGLPEFRIRFRELSLLRPCPPMPEIAVHENGDFCRGENQIRFPGQAWVVFPETQASPPNGGTERFFRFRVLPFYGGHYPRPGFFVDRIHAFIIYWFCSKII